MSISFLSPFSGQSGNEQTEIRVREENGNMIFEKDKMNDLEIKFFNPAYFSMIGFPDAEISMVNKDTGEPIGLESSSATNVNPDQTGEQIEETQETPIDGEAQNTEQDQPMDGEVQNAEQGTPIDGEVQNAEQEPPNDGDAQNAEQEPPNDGEVQNAEQPMDGEAQNVEQETQLDGDAQNVETPPPTNNVPNAQTSEIKGGYYNNVDELTRPFRDFVYMIQPSRRPLFDKTSSSTNDRPNSFGISSFYDRIKSAFSRNDSKQQDGSIQDGESNAQNASEADTPEETQEANNVENSTEGMSIMWVVKIPIVGSPETDVNKKQQNELNDIIREFRANKSNKIKVTGERYSVGARTIKIAKNIDDGDDVLNVATSKLIGTKMQKYAKLNGPASSSWF
jgi:hypothetical protein